MSAASVRHQRAARIHDALSRAETELRLAWDEAWADVELPDRDDELADFCQATLERLWVLKTKVREARDRNRNAARRE